MIGLSVVPGSTGPPGEIFFFSRPRFDAINAGGCKVNRQTAITLHPCWAGDGIFREPVGAPPLIGEIIWPLSVGPMIPPSRLARMAAEGAIGP